MPCIVLLKSSKNVLVVKGKWCEKLNVAENRNGGLSSSELMKIFFSPDETIKPNFDLEAANEFDETKTACYYGYVLGDYGRARRNHNFHNDVDAYSNG